MATTAALIRDRIVAVIEALTPASLANDKFRKYRNEGAADFTGWATGNGKAAAWRRFQIRDLGDDTPPEVSNTDVELRSVWYEVRVAYPQTHRAGRDGALDRDDVMAADQHAIETAIGMRGRANFADPYPVASWAEGSTSREISDGVDFLVIRQRMIFYLSLVAPNTDTGLTALWIWGQSNSTTMAPVADLTDQSYNASYAAVQMVARQSHDLTPTWVETPQQDLGPISDFQPGTGAKIGLSSSMARDLDAADPGDFAVIHTGAWGSGSTFWDPSGTEFDDMITYVQAQMAALGCTSVVLVMKHGEEDSKTLNLANAYDDWLAGFIDSVREELGELGPNNTEIPVVVGQLSATSTYGAFTTETRTSITNIDTMRSNVTVVDLDSVALDAGEATPTHFDANGFIAIGHLYAGTVANVLGIHIPPIADWDASANALEVTFTDASLSPSDPITSYAWTFGDGNTSTDENPVHTYAAGGTYTVQLIITNSNGATDSHSSDINVSGLNVESDATSGAYLPATNAEWTAMIADIANGMSNPDEFWRFGALASGNAPGVRGIIDLTTLNTPLYQQAVTGWSTKAVAWGEGTTKGFASTDADLPDMGTDDALVLMYVALTAPAAGRNVLQLGTPSASRSSVEALNTGPYLRTFQGGTATVGSSAVGTFSGVRAILFKVDRTNSAIRCYTDVEKISPVWDADGLGKAIAIGAGATGGSPLLSCAASVIYMALWKGAGARISDAQAKSLITGLGNGLWTPPWT
jgi:PKD repeat protein